MSAEIKHQLGQLHAAMLGVGDQIRALTAENVPERTIATLYPMDGESWSQGLISHFRSPQARSRYLEHLGTHFMHMAPDNKQQRRVNFISSMTTEHGNELHAIYSDWAKGPAASELIALIAGSDQFYPREKIAARLSAVYARMLIAQRWEQLEELHPKAAEFAQVQRGMRFFLSL